MAEEEDGAALRQAGLASPSGAPAAARAAAFAADPPPQQQQERPPEEGAAGGGVAADQVSASVVEAATLMPLAGSTLGDASAPPSQPSTPRPMRKVASWLALNAGGLPKQAVHAVGSALKLPAMHLQHRLASMAGSTAGSAVAPPAPPLDPETLRRTRKAFPMHADTEDFAEVLAHIRRAWPAAPMVAIGFSMGSNVLVKHIGEAEPGESPLLAGVSVCNGYDIVEGSRNLVNERRLADGVITAALRKLLRRKLPEVCACNPLCVWAPACACVRSPLPLHPSPPPVAQPAPRRHLPLRLDGHADLPPPPRPPPYALSLSYARPPLPSPTPPHPTRPPPFPPLPLARPAPPRPGHLDLRCARDAGGL